MGYVRVQWISVGEMLPSPGQHVILLTADLGQYFGHLDYERCVWSDYRRDWELGEVLFWMLPPPLPVEVLGKRKKLEAQP